MSRVATVLIALVFVAGCADAPAKSSVSSSSAPAPVPTVNEDHGSIAGNVSDEELRPLAGVEVSVVEPGISVKTDSAGQFTINDLAPGKYSLVANRIGYEQVGKRVEVAAGKVTTASFSMKSLLIESEGYHNSIPSTFFITFGWGLFDAFVTWRVTNTTCNPCQRHIDFQRGPIDVRAEPVWKSSLDTPATNKVAYVWTERNTEGASVGTGGENVWSEYIKNGVQHRFTAGELEKLKTFKDFRINVGGGAADAMVQQKLDVWFTTAYIQVLPDEFTAVPPA